MSLCARGDADDATAYLTEHLTTDDYYRGEDAGCWIETPATRRMGLARRVNSRAFAAIAAGCAPSGERLIGGKRHRAGWDCTFSAPKAVSVLHGLLPDAERETLRAAHERAVDRAVGQLSTHAIRCRVGRGGAAQLSAASVAARFTHQTSREHDPQLHSHVFVANCALRSDGEWGAIESRHLYQWQRAIGTLYRAELAAEMRGLGYSVQADGSSFRIAGLSKHVLDEFSTRRRQIELEALARGVHSAAGFEAVTLATRCAKREVAADELRADWIRRAALHGVTPSSIAMLAQPDLHQAPTVVDVDEILSELTRNRAVFRLQDLWARVAERVQIAGGGIDRCRSIVNHVIKHDLVALPDQRFTTHEMLAVERSALNAAMSLYRRTAHAVPARLVGRSLSVEQNRALRHLVADEGLTVIEGRAGTGKSYLLGAAFDSWRQAGRQVVGAALSGKAAQGLEEGSGIPAQTIHSLLDAIDRGSLQLDSATVLVIDEAGMVGTRQMAAILDAAERAGAKLALVGDSRQLQSIEAGGVFARLSRDCSAVELTEIRRQKSAGDRSVVEALVGGRAADALNLLHEMERIHVSDGAASAQADLVRQWLPVYSKSPPAQTLIIAATRGDVRALNDLARRALRADGGIGADQLDVDGVSFGLGDRILFLRNDRGLGVKNGTLGVVRGFHNSKASVELDDGRFLDVDVTRYPHITHGYAVTCHKAQGVTTDNVFLHVSDRMTSREWGYVAASRHRERVDVYCDRGVHGALADDLEWSDPQEMAIDSLPIDEVDLLFGAAIESTDDQIKAVTDEMVQ